MEFEGLLIGLGAFLLIGVFHPLVIKAEYHFGEKSWMFFLLIALVSSVISLFVQNNLLSMFLGVLGFASFWSVLEIFKQHERVKQGRFPKKLKEKQI